MEAEPVPTVPIKAGANEPGKSEDYRRRERCNSHRHSLVSPTEDGGPTIQLPAAEAAAPFQRLTPHSIPRDHPERSSQWIVANTRVQPCPVDACERSRRPSPRNTTRCCPGHERIPRDRGPHRASAAARRRGIQSDGHLILSRGGLAGSETLCLWTRRRGQPTTVPMKHPSVKQATFSPDGRVIVSGRDEVIRLWMTDAGEPLSWSIEGAHPRWAREAGCVGSSTRLTVVRRPSGAPHKSAAHLEPAHGRRPR